MEGYYLVTYYDNDEKIYFYDITSDVEYWVDEMLRNTDNDFILVNVLPVSKKFAGKWRGML